jgi:hypothetical protein
LSLVAISAQVHTNPAALASVDELHPGIFRTNLFPVRGRPKLLGTYYITISMTCGKARAPGGIKKNILWFHFSAAAAAKLC